jgi:hypothetical protein
MTAKLAISPPLAYPALSLTIRPSLLGRIPWDIQGLLLLLRGIQRWHRVLCRPLQHHARLALSPSPCTAPSKGSLPKKPGSSHHGRNRSAPRLESCAESGCTASPCRRCGILARTVLNVRFVFLLHDHKYLRHFRRRLCRRDAEL